MNNFKFQNFDEIKNKEILQKEINALVDNAKEIEKTLSLIQNQEQNRIQNENDIKKEFLNNMNKINNLNKNNNYNKDKKLLERQLRGLKYIFGLLEKNYYFTSPYHEDLKIMIEDEEKMTEEISNQIINLYLSKNFTSCYNLWKKYNFKMLIGVSYERAFDMLKYLNKLRDRYENRAPIINSININNLPHLDYNNNNNNNQSSLFSNIHDNSYYKNNSQITSSDIYNMKLNQNEEFTKKLRRQIDNIKKIQNINK